MRSSRCRGESRWSGRDFALEDAAGGAPHVVEDDVCGGGVVQHLQARHDEHSGAGVLGGNVAVELNLYRKIFLIKRTD